jgi:hypothetical protein
MRQTLPFIERWNAQRPAPITFFEIIVAACGRVLHERPGLNRFVSGGVIYQRRKVHIAFGVKKAFDDNAPLLMVKLEMAANEPLEQTTQRIRDAIAQARADAERPLEREIRLFTNLPGPVLSGVVRVGSWLEAWNLMPQLLTRSDPMYSSLFLANLGGIGLDRAFHHLYEWGTASMFGVVGAIAKTMSLGTDGRPSQHDELNLFWTFDERINDGFYCATTLALLKHYIEQPQLLAAKQLEPAVEAIQPAEA